MAIDLRSNFTGRERRLEPQTIEVLQKINSMLPASAARDENLRALEQTETLTVVTGQQIGLFLGPVLCLYKALSAIAIARAIEQQSGKRTVPIFWLQTEDHDFEEIRLTNILTREAKQVTLELSSSPESKRCSVAYRTISAEIDQAYETLETHLGEFPYAREVLPLLKNHYRQGVSMNQAFAGLLAELTKQHGLVFFNPREAGSEQLFQPVFQRALREESRINEDLKKLVHQLRQTGDREQVALRDNSPLFFFHEGSREGPRYRLERDGGYWSSLGGTARISEQDLQQTLLKEPDRFTSSALLRPILQDSIFPTAVYVAGETEEQYFRQIGPLYEIFDIEKPLILPRAHFTIIEAKTKKWLHELGLVSEDLTRSRLELLEKVSASFLTEERRPETLIGTVSENVEQALRPLEESFSTVDATLLGTLNKSRDKMLRLLDNMKERYTQAIIRKNETSLERVNKLGSLLYPEAKPQERVISPVYFLCRYGLEFVEQIFNSIEAGVGEFQEVEL